MQNIEDVIPKSLDDIIRKRRETYRLKMASEAELVALPLMVDAIGDRQMRVKEGEISEWRIIKLASAKNDGVMFAIGFRRGKVCMTSPVRSMDVVRGKGMILTNNSLYKLGHKGEGEPDFHLLMHICAVFWAWGIGDQFGVPHVFY